MAIRAATSRSASCSGCIAPRAATAARVRRTRTSRPTPGTPICASRPRTAPASMVRAMPPRRRPAAAAIRCSPGFDEADTLPFGGYLPVVTVDPDVEVLATYIPDFPIYPPETSWMRQPKTDIPAITGEDLAGWRQAGLVRRRPRPVLRPRRAVRACPAARQRGALGARRSRQGDARGHARGDHRRALPPGRPPRAASQQPAAAVARARTPVRPRADRSGGSARCGSATRRRPRSACALRGNRCRLAARATSWSSPSAPSSTTRSSRSLPADHSSRSARRGRIRWMRPLPFSET